MPEKIRRVVDPKLLAAIRKQPCAACGCRPPSDAHHIRTKGAGGPDTDWNVFPLDRRCHRCWHQIGARAFCDGHPAFRFLLESKGWSFDDRNHLWNRNLLPT